MSEFVPRTETRKFVNHITLCHHRFVALELRKHQRFSICFQRSFNGFHRPSGAVIVKEIVAISPIRFVGNQRVNAIDALHRIGVAFKLILFKKPILQTSHIRHFRRGEIQKLLGHRHLFIRKFVGKERQTLARYGIVCQSEDEFQNKARLSRTEKSIVIDKV